MAGSSGANEDEHRGTLAKLALLTAVCGVLAALIGVAENGFDVADTVLRRDRGAEEVPAATVAPMPDRPTLLLPKEGTTVDRSGTPIQVAGLAEDKAYLITKGPVASGRQFLVEVTVPQASSVITHSGTLGSCSDSEPGQPYKILLNEIAALAPVPAGGGELDTAWVAKNLTAVDSAEILRGEGDNC